MGDVVAISAREQPDEISPDTIQELERLLADAKRGRVTGLAYVALLQHKGAFTVSTAGRAKDSPVYTLGAVHLLSNYLVDLAE